jgi:hypothetical protein
MKHCFMLHGYVFLLCLVPNYLQKQSWHQSYQQQSSNLKTYPYLLVSAVEFGIVMLLHQIFP